MFFAGYDILKKPNKRLNEYWFEKGASCGKESHNVFEIQVSRFKSVFFVRMYSICQTHRK